MILFSAQANGFYDTDIHTMWPPDAMAITAERHAELMEAQSAGKLIAADAEGAPVAVDPPPPPARTPLLARLAARLRPGRTAA